MSVFLGPDMKYRSRRMNISLVCILVLSILSTLVSGNPGIYCENTTVCSCDSACFGGYEASNLFNTIDSCPDGPQYAYEDVENVSIRVFNNSNFSTGKTIEITAYFKTIEADPLMIFYNNGSGFYRIFNTTAINDGFEDYSTNISLDKVSGNHTVRALIYYEGATPYSGQSCGYDLNNYYSDTDDISFLVEEGDLTIPIITNNNPRSQSYFLGEIIKINATITDNDFVKSAYVNITLPGGNITQLDMSQSGTYFEVDYSLFNEMGTYHYVIYAKDDSENYASKQGNFSVSYSINISSTNPSNNSYHNTTSIDLNLSVLDENFIVDLVKYELNGASNITIVPFSISSNNSILGELNNSDKNISQSFNVSRNMTLGKIFLKIRKKENSSSQIELSLDSGGPGEVLAHAILNNSIGTSSSFYTIFLNQTVKIVKNQKYWLTLKEGNNLSYFYWSYSENYSQGEYKDNNSLDLIFRLFESEKYTAQINISIVNKLKIYINNSIGLEQSKIIDFYYDITPPNFNSVEESGDPFDYGKLLTISANLSDDHSLSECIVEINGSNYTMNKESLFRFNYSYFPEKGFFEYKFYFNDSADFKNNSGIFNFTVIDIIPPTLNYIIYSPNNTQGIDPNISILVQVNVTDPSNITNVILFYGLYSLNNSKVMVENLSYNNGLYQSNFTLNETGIYQFRTYAKDSSLNENYSEIFYLNSSYDNTYEIMPLSLQLGVYGGIIGQNKSLGNITVNNTGDYSIHFNFYKSIETVPELYFSENGININPKSEKIINITALTPIIDATYHLTFVTNSSISNVKDKEINGTLIAQKGGAYLYAEFLNYPETVTLSSKRNNFSIKITNIGNETGYNLTYKWILPFGWTSREELEGNQTQLDPGYFIITTVYLDIPDSSSSSTKQISLFVNSSNSTSLIEKTINIQGVTQEIMYQTVIGGDSSGRIISRPSIGVGIISPLFSESNSFNLTIGGTTTIEINLTNKNKNILWKNFEIEIEGYPLSKIEISENEINEVMYNQTKRFYLNFEVPGYNQEERKTVQIKLIATQFDAKQNLSSEVTFRKEIELLILKEGHERFCTDSAKENIKEIKELKMNVQYLEIDLKDAEKYISNNDFDSARKLCMHIKDEKEKAIILNEEIKLLENEIKKMKENYFEVETLTKSLEDIKNLLSQGQIDSAKTTLDNLKYLVELENKANELSPKRIGEKVMKEHPIQIISMLLVIGIIANLIYLKGRKIKQKLVKKMCVKEEEKINELIKKTQKKYFENDMMSEELFRKYMNQYKKMFANLTNKKIKIKIEEEFEKNRNGEDRIKYVKHMISTIQEKYYVNHSVDEKTYNQTLNMLLEKLSELERRRK